MSTSSSLTLTELEIVQNPAFGAFLIWQFTLGYQEHGSNPAPFPLAFLALPCLLHRPTLEEVKSTRKTSGLGLFAAKFDKEREILVGMHNRALQLRPLSLQSIGLASTSKLIRVDYANASLYAYPLALLGVRKPTVPQRLMGFAAAADKLGFWFSKLSLAQVAATLRVDF